MISEAAKRYEQLYSIRPKGTPDRLRMYHSTEVNVPLRKSLKKTCMEGSIDREKRDSYLLRVTKQLVTNTDHYPEYETIQHKNRTQNFQKAPFTRIIGDVRTQDYSLPLIQNCDHRCSQAFVTLPHQNTIVTQRDMHKYRSKHYHLKFEKQLSREQLSDSLNLKKMGSIKSTQISESSEMKEPIKKRIREGNAMEYHEALKKIRKFDHDIGHKYGDNLFIPKEVPEFYNIEKSKGSIIKKSLSTPKGNVYFGTFKDQIKTRYDRSDPLWSMSIQYDQAYENPQISKTIDLGMVSQRKPNEVYSKYPFRQNMNLKIPLNK